MKFHKDLSDNAKISAIKISIIMAVMNVLDITDNAMSESAVSIIFGNYLTI